MIYIALASLAALCTNLIVTANVLRAGQRQHAREREQLLNKIMHLAGKTWEEPPRELVVEDEIEPGRYAYAPEQDPEL